MSKQSEAVRLWLAGNGIKNKECAEKIGTSTPNISNYLAGRRAFSKRIADKFSEVYGFSIPFLLYGEGTLFPSQTIVDSSIVNNGNVHGNGSSININQANAALQAENERLRNEVEWLREQLSKKQ